MEQNTLPAVKVMLTGFSLRRDMCEPFLLAPFSLAANLNKDIAGRRVDVYPMAFGMDVSDKEFLRAVFKLRPNIVGFSTYLWNADRAAALVKHIKAIDKHIVTVAGGPEAGNAPEKYCSAFDVVVSGEAELSFNNLVALLVSDMREQISGVPNFFVKEGSAVSGGRGAAAIPLDKLKSPFIDGYIRFDPQRIYSIDYEMSRGCPFKCEFCTWAGQSMQFFPLGRVDAELELIFSRPNVRALYLNDSNILLKRDYGEQALKLLVKRNINNCSVYFNLNPEYLDDDIIHLLASGKNHLYGFGLQTTNKDTHKKISRAFSKKRFSASLNKLCNNNSRAEICFDTIYGLPGETMDDFKDTLAFAMEFNPGRIHTFPLLALPGSGVAEKARDYQISFNPNPPHEIFRTATFSPADIEAAKAAGLAYDFICGMPAVKTAVFRLLTDGRSRVDFLISTFSKLLAAHGIGGPLPNNIPLSQKEWDLFSAFVNNTRRTDVKKRYADIAIRELSAIQGVSAGGKWMALLKDYSTYLDMEIKAGSPPPPASRKPKSGAPYIRLTYSPGADLSASGKARSYYYPLNANNAAPAPRRQPRAGSTTEAGP